MTNATYSTQVLEQIKKNFTSEIEQFVINDLEEYGNDWYSHLQDVINHGCVSGTVSSLIYYNDTAKFHDDFENEIDELIENYVADIGLSFSEIAHTIDVWDIGQLKNWKAWFAYEETAYRINSSLENGEYEELEEEEEEQ